MESVWVPAGCYPSLTSGPELLPITCLTHTAGRAVSSLLSGAPTPWRNEGISKSMLLLLSGQLIPLKVSCLINGMIEANKLEIVTEESIPTWICFLGVSNIRDFCSSHLQRRISLSAYQKKSDATHTQSLTDHGRLSSRDTVDNGQVLPNWIVFYLELSIKLMWSQNPLSVSQTSVISLWTSYWWIVSSTGPPTHTDAHTHIHTHHGLNHGLWSFSCISFCHQDDLYCGEVSWKFPSFCEVLGYL